MGDGTPAQAGGGSVSELEDQTFDEELEVGSMVKFEDAAVGASRRLSSKADPENAAAGRSWKQVRWHRRRWMTDESRLEIDGTAGGSTTKGNRKLVVSEAAGFIAGASR